MKKISIMNNNNDNLFGDFCRYNIITEKMLRVFNTFLSLPSVATDHRKQFKCLNMILNNKINHYFWN